MFKQVLGDDTLTQFAIWGLVIFVAVFVGIAVWALTRSRKTVSKWSRIPLEDEPVESRDADANPQQA